MNKQNETIKPLTNWLMTIGQIPSSYLVSMTYEEQLLWLCNFLKTEVIPKTNANIEAVNQLIKFIDDYFDNLDIQEEVNNKLEEMAESGELTELISAYLNSQALIVFDTLNDMKNAENLINGSRCKTLGYYTINDGGGANYFVREVTNQDVENDGDIVSLNDDSLVAEILPDEYLTFIQFGAKGDDETDDTTSITNALTYANTYSININLLEKTYYTLSNLTIDNIKIKDGTLDLHNYYFNIYNKCELHNIKILGGYKEATIILNDVENLIIDNCYILGGLLCRTHATNTKITNTIFEGHGYHILFDDQTGRTDIDSIGNGFTCENCEFIIDNATFGGDLIEINVPNYGFKNVIVKNNNAHLKENITPTTASIPAAIGFGFANVDKIIIDNNIMDSVSNGNGVFHLETCNNAIISNNQILNSKSIYYDNIQPAMMILASEKFNITNNIISDYPIGIYLINDSYTSSYFNIANNYFKVYKYGIYGNKLSDFTIGSNRFYLSVLNDTITTDLQGIAVYEYNTVVGLQNSIINDNYFYLTTSQLSNEHYTYSLNISSSLNCVINNNYTRGIGRGNTSGVNAGSGFKTAVANNENANFIISNTTPTSNIDGSSSSIVADTNNGILYKYIDGNWVPGCVIYNEDMTDFSQTATNYLAVTVVKKNGVKSIINTASSGTALTSGTEYTLMTINDAKARPSYRIRTMVTTVCGKDLFIDIATDGVVKITPQSNIVSGDNTRFILTYI